MIKTKSAILFCLLGTLYASAQKLPYLTSRMGVSVVKGLPGPADAKYHKLLACAEHYAVHSGPEWSHHELNINDLRSAIALYFKGLMPILVFFKYH